MLLLYSLRFSLFFLKSNFDNFNIFKSIKYNGFSSRSRNSNAVCIGIAQLSVIFRSAHYWAHLRRHIPSLVCDGRQSED